jgi:diacylglycerol kinase family enzyme
LSGARRPTLSTRQPGGRARLEAIGAIALGAVSIVLAVLALASTFPEGLAAPACVVVALLLGLLALTHRGAARAAAAALALAALAASIVLLGLRGGILAALAVAAGFLALAAATAAFRVRVPLPRAARPSRPVLFYNPLSGGGKAARFALPDEARSRGIEAVELTHGRDLGDLVRSAVANGADALAMAGGDGSQAIVAAIAAEHSLPYACIPAGTRNHFALDLGVDRDDVVGALDALTDGGERVVDLAEVNGRIFVNNVSIGVYGAAVQRAGYRNAKLRTLIDTAPDMAGPNAESAQLAWTDSEGEEHRGRVTLLVSNNPYLLRKLVGAGTRPRLDEGLLGIVVVDPSGGRSRRRRLVQWSDRSFEIAASAPVPAGVDGEAAMLEPPLQFRSRPAALRVRIAPSHPGAAPSAVEPMGLVQGLGALISIAAGRAPGTAGSGTE